MGKIEKGYWHPDEGYWQCIGEPSEELLASWPDGTIEIPIKPGDNYTYDGTQWVAPSAAVVEAKLALIARSQRNELLKKSDWTQIADAPVNQLEWANYRQALRDIPQQQGFPNTINWPTEPA